jgi:putative oxidoreductase
MTRSSATAIAQTLFRGALGVTLIAHGTQKLFGWFGGGGLDGTSTAFDGMGFRPGKAHAVLAGIGETGAGAALALGLATPVAGAGGAITMGVAAGIHAKNGFFATKGGLEYPAILAVAATTFALGGSGVLSLDAASGRVFDRPWMRAVALTAIPVAMGSQLFRRSRVLKADNKAGQGSSTKSNPGESDN